MLYEPGPGDRSAANGERQFNIYDYRLKNVEPGKVQYRTPANIPRDVAARLRSISMEVIRALGLRDMARLDYRVTQEGRIYLLEANALPQLASHSSLFAATAQVGLTYNATISMDVVRALGLRDMARLDYRVTQEGRIYLLEANALPQLASHSSLFAATAQVGLTYNATIAAILNAAALRSGLATAA